MNEPKDGRYAFVAGEYGIPMIVISAKRRYGGTVEH